VAAERIAGAQGRLDVELGAGLEPVERAARERLGDSVEGERPVCGLDDGQAAPVERHRVADRGLARGERSFEADADPVAVAVDRRDATALTNDAGEHRLSLASSLRLVDIRGEQDVFTHAA